MSKEKTRRVNLHWSPEIEALTKSQKIRVKTGSYHGSTKFECTGEMSIYCATQMIRDLRRALRKIRDDETAKLNAQVNRAEAPL